MSKQNVVSRILTEDILSLSDARNELHELYGKRPDKASLARWVHRGVGGVKLEAVALGRQLFTSRQALTRFIEERTAKALGDSESTMHWAQAWQLQLIKDAERRAEESQIRQSRVQQLREMEQKRRKESEESWQLQLIKDAERRAEESQIRQSRVQLRGKTK